MTVSDIVNDLAGDWTRKPPAEELAIRNLLAGCKQTLPGDYLSFLRLSNGGEGELSIKPWWFQMWPAEELVQTNHDYNVQESIPGFIGFGSSGGGELFAFDTRTAQPWRVYMIPFITMQKEDAIEVADSFITFLLAMGRSKNPG